LNQPVSKKSDTTIRESYEQVASQTGVRPPELDPPPLPQEALFLWGYFIELHSTRGGGMGPAAISYAEIEAWQRLTRRYLPSWQITAIKRMDQAFMRVESERQKRDQG
jgi:hypothetical protein